MRHSGTKRQWLAPQTVLIPGTLLKRNKTPDLPKIVSSAKTCFGCAKLNGYLQTSEMSGSRVFRFGVFEVDERSAELRKHGVRVKIHSQPFQVLVMLLERPAELVTREEVRQRLWDENTFVDFDHGLNTAINKVRQALRDSAAEPRYVETVSGKGYRFIAPVSIAASHANVSATPPAMRDAVPQAEPDDPAPGEPPTLSPSGLLTAPHELPVASRTLVRTLLLLTEGMYLAFYVGALANLPEIHEILEEARVLVPSTLFATLVVTAALLIPVRLFLCAATALDFKDLPAKFTKLFPLLLLLDLLWAVSPFLLVHHVNVGLALGMSAALVYLPFAQRSLVLMYARPR